MPSKIPQSEWAAVVARREQGEPVAAIARSYDCSPALVYSILKRQESAAAVEPGIGTPPVVTERAPTEPAASHDIRDSEPVADEPAAATSEPDMPEAGSAMGAEAEAAPRPIALTAQLDDELRGSIEAAIGTFAAAFDGALAARGSGAEARDALRKAAADLMRAGARTIIVLERLEATTATSLDQAKPTAERVDAHRAPNVSASEVTGLVSPVEGTVKWYNPKKGFGFVAVADGKDVFVRAQALKRSGLPGLQVGQAVRLTTRPAAKGPEADRIELV